MKSRIRLVLLTAATAAVVMYAFGRGTETVAVAQDRRSGVDFRLPDLNGKPWAMREHRGKVVLVNFWATWCPPCRMETPGLVNIYREYSPKGYTSVGISMDEEGPQLVKEFVSRYRVPYPILMPGDTNLGSNIAALPTSLLIDKDGHVAKTYRGMIDEAELREDIERLLAE